MPSSVRATWCARISSVADRSVRIRPGPRRGGDLLGYPVLEQHPVGQPGQRVVEGLVLQLLLELVLCRHVPQREDQAGDVRLGPQVAASGLDADASAIPASDLPFHDTRAESRALSQPHEGAGEVVAILLRDQVPQALAFHGDVSEDGRGRGRRVLDGPVVRDDHDGIRGVLDKRPEIGLVALADRFLAEHDTLQREGHLVREDFQCRGKIGKDPLLSEHCDQAGRSVTGRPVLEHQGAEQHPVSAWAGRPGLLGQPPHRGENRGCPGHEGQPRFGQLAQLLSLQQIGISVHGAKRPVDPHAEQRVAL